MNPIAKAKTSDILSTGSVFFTARSNSYGAKPRALHIRSVAERVSNISTGMEMLIMDFPVKKFTPILFSKNLITFF